MNDKKLITQNELTDIISNYIKHRILEMCPIFNHWTYECFTDYTKWEVQDDKGRWHFMGSHLTDDHDHWVILTCGYGDEHTDIRIFNDHVEFVEESEFGYFSKEFMYGLYMNIKEVVESDNKHINDDNDIIIQTPIIHEMLSTGILYYKDRRTVEDFLKKYFDENVFPKMRTWGSNILLEVGCNNLSNDCLTNSHITPEFVVKFTISHGISFYTIDTCGCITDGHLGSVISNIIKNIKPNDSNNKKE